MPTLVLSFAGKVIREYACPTTGVTIGRSADNTIVIDNLAVSGHHAQIDLVGSHYVITDLQSTNGTFVNERKASTSRLAEGDNIAIAKHTISFIGDRPAQEPEVEAEQPATMVLETRKHKELLAMQAGNAPSQAHHSPSPMASSAKTPSATRAPAARLLTIIALGAIAAGIIVIG